MGRASLRGPLCYKHNPGPFACLKRCEAAAAFVEIGKSLLMRDMPKIPLDAVGPSVIAANEGLFAASAAGKLHTTMPTGVTESAHLPVAPAHGQDRRPGGLAG